jgi:hypothetical protein
MAYSTKKIDRFKWSITASRRIEASPHSVWKAISNPGNLEDCHPFCEKNPVDKWPGVGSKDTIYYYSGMVLYRDFTNWIDGVGYDLTIGKKGGRKSFVSWRITQEQGNISTLSITIYPHILQNIPAAIRWIPHIAYVRPSLGRYLESVVKGFEWFIRTGKPVNKNQFGSHRWFSTENI